MSNFAVLKIKNTKEVWSELKFRPLKINSKLDSMIKHVVFFRLPDSVSQENKKIQLEKMDQIFSALKNQLPYIADYKTGINFNTAPHKWDFIIDSTFKSKEDLQRYMDSTEHQEAIRKASGIEKTKAVIDYEY